ncbi:hypothetical protein MACK_002522 [Theileria orientalis]|uniref:Uncharacterized protein n=1 Tax=Theileria orientalis TaxID=68886 RepID=A0A976QVV1_THEOR|nr:hypothetical protein MACK_002522 [Theileria orientalis]
MTCIYLYVRKPYTYRAGKCVTVKVWCENEYEPSKLFIKHSHTLCPATEGCIYVFKGGWNFKNYLTVSTDGPYKSTKLAKVDVYFNRYENTKPLLFVLHFQKNDGGNGVQNRYYRMSSYDKDKASCKPKRIEDLCQYNNDESILCALIEENDALKEFLTYDIMQRPNNNNGSPCTYNCEKIEVTDTTKNGEEPTLGNGFTRFKHTPKNGDRGSKPACIVYNCNTLLGSDGKEEVKDVQDQQYDCIKVYFGGKAKRQCADKGKAPCGEAATCTKGEGKTCPLPTSGDGNTCNTECQDVPLMIALQKQGSGGDGDGNNTDYYVHRRRKNGETGSNDTYYWVQLKLENNGQNGLKQLLNDIGLETASNGLANGALQALLGKTVNGSGPTYLTLLLKRLEFDLTDSVVILLDYPKSVSSGQNGGYNDEQIEQAIGTLGSGGTNGNINPLKLNSHNIQVSDANSGTNKCLTKHKYRVVTHDFEKAVSGLGAKCSAGLRFLIHTRDNGTKYRELKLYDDATRTDPAYLEYKYYSRGSNGAHTQTESKVYVVFYKGETTGGSQGDPRPLLLCYDGQTYKPKDKNEYDQTWVKVEGVKKCLCQNGSENSNGENEALLKAVTGVVGFLNQVDLSQHPGGPSTSSEAGGQGCTTGTTSAPGATCQTDSDATTTGSTCTYTVHRYDGKEVKVQVKCESVTTTTGTSGSKTCYRKLTHRPAGMNGKDAANGAKGFRLGDIVHTNDRSKLDYYSNGLTASTQNKYSPLLSVSAYFYDSDTKYCDPLLVVLEFAKVTPANGVTGTEKECYKLTKSNGDQLEWEKDPEAKKLVGQDTDNGKLARHLDAIRYCLKKVVRIQLEFNGKNGTQYPLMGRDANIEPGSGFTPINGTSGNGKVTVEVLPCPALTGSNYKCFKHGLTEALKSVHYQVAGLAFTLPGKNGSVIEIPLYNGADGQCTGDAASHQLVGQEVKCANGQGQTSQSGSKITYNKCMGDICVYFYGTGGSTSDETTDTVPLMLRYDGRFYRPETRDSYFDKWECVSELASVACKPGCKCVCCCGTNDDGRGADFSADCDCCSTLVTQLNKVNLALNQIDLYPDKSGDQGYGLPESGGGGGGKTGYKLDDKVGNERVKVVTQKPSGSDAKNAYVRVVHRTKNGFLIGEIMYTKQEIVEHGVKVKGAQNSGSGDTTIRIANGGKNHQAQVSTYKWNTVVAYYSKTDTTYSLPQLIVILKTGNEVESGNGNTVTGSANTPYGYYVLATQSGVGGGGTGSGYQYQWRLVNGEEAKVTLDDKTDFTLINSAIILTHWRDTGGSGSYSEPQICPAVRSAIQNKSLNESPGNPGKVNRLTGKTITVADEKCTSDDSGSGTCTSSGEGTSPVACCCKCLAGTNFKVMTHCLDNLVKLGSGFEKLTEVKLIAGLRFLTPTRTKGEYKQLTLKDNGASDLNGSIKYHQSTNGNKICVYFYGSDPRPLLVCYNGWAYAAKTMEEYNNQKWTKDDEAAECKCTDPTAESCDKCPLLKSLVAVSDFLNPVDIKMVPMSSQYCKCYSIHTFNGRKIWIRVSSQPACGSFCYHKYTHTHAGITGKGDGFRLGNIHYKSVEGRDSCIKLVDGSGTSVGSNNGNNNKCISASQGKNGDQKCGSFPFVVVFYYKLDDKHQTPIVVAMCSGECNKLECNLYYVLKNRADKKYEKGSNGLTMDDDTKLGKELEKALFTNSKHLQIVLSTRPVPRDYKAEKDKKCENDKPEESSSQGPYVMDYHDNVKKMAGLRSCNVKTLNSIATAPDSDEKKAKLKPMLYHVLRETSYEAQLFDKNGRQPVSPPGTTLKITVKEVKCDKSYTNAGYRCFRHVLVNTQGIEDVGGLKLAVFSGHGTQGSVAEITLCTGVKGANNGKKVEPLTYTVCKGDLYVFFYGEDPRPLMLCYDNNAYRPMTMETYCKEWVRVNENGSGATTGSGCADPKIGDPKVLGALYDVSQFMNPVRLCLGPDAYKTLDPKHGQQQQQQQPAAQSGQGKQAKPAKLEWSYPIDQNPKPPVCVRVTGIDLRCYKQYVHQPEKQGFRLGAVTYAGSEGAAKPAQNGTCSPAAPGASPTTTTPYCFEYESSKQLLSVCVYYYMYDIDHNWPLVVELGFKSR